MSVNQEQQREYAAKIAFGLEEQLRRIAPTMDMIENWCSLLRTWKLFEETPEQKENRLFFEQWSQRVNAAFDPVGGLFFPAYPPLPHKNAVKVEEMYKKLREMVNDLNIKFLMPSRDRFYDPYPLEIHLSDPAAPQLREKFLTIHRGKHRRNQPDNYKLGPIFQIDIEGSEKILFDEDDGKDPVSVLMKAVRDISEHPPLQPVVHSTAHNYDNFVYRPEVDSDSE